jgi:YVTN family beta-propeller protein
VPVGRAAAAASPAAGGRLSRLTARSWAWVSEEDYSANGALFVGSQAALIVDPGLSPLHARRFVAAARQVTDRPLRFIVLTHAHPDHSLGAVCLQEPGARLVAHPLTRRAIAEDLGRARRELLQTGDAARRASLADCSFHLPEPLAAAKEVFDLGDHQVEVRHLGPAHTAGDVIVWSAAEKVLASGDLFLHDASPSLGEGSTRGWLAALQTLIALGPRHVIPGHFAPAQVAALGRFRAYLQAQWDRAAAAIAKGATVEQVAAQASFPEFAAFRQHPEYQATFADNARAMARELLARPAAPGARGGFTTLAVLDVGAAPHQIVFSADGRRAFVAAAGAERITEVDVATRQVVGSRPAAGTPLGLAVGADGGLIASLFTAGALARLPAAGPATARLPTGGGPSLLVGPLPDGRLLVAVEEAARLRLLDPRGWKLAAEFPTGKRPFPPAFTSDGRQALVPSYDDGTVTVVDLWNQRVVATVPVGPKLSGGAVLPGDSEYAVAVRGEDRIAWFSTAEHREVGTLREGIGQGPFSLVVSPDGRQAFVNNTGSHDISVIDLATRRVTARVPVGEIPIVLAVHPLGETLWVSCEGAHRLHILSIPKAPPPPAAPPAAAPTEVAVLGMIHGEHRKSPRWDLAAVRATLRKLAPDVVCAEIPPDRWPTIWQDFAERGGFTDARIKVFPEYTDVLLPLAAELGFTIEPCAAWTKEMSDLREARLKAFDKDPALAAARAEYSRRTKELEARHAAQPIVEDDPRVIHSPLYDERTREELALYDQYQNDWIGPGGWTNINQAHFRLIDQALRRHRGKRVVVTFGAAHKYWFLDRLRARPDVKLLDVAPFLPSPSSR